MSRLHELVTALAAPWVVLSPRSGQLTGSGAEGVYARDRRILSRLAVTVDGREPVPVHVGERDAATHEYVAQVEGLGDTRHDPTVMLYRTRTVESDGMTERITLVNRSRTRIECRLEVALGTDLAGTAAVRSGAATSLPQLAPLPDGPSRTHWESDDTRVVVTADPGFVATPQLEPGAEYTLTLHVTADFPKSTTGFSIEPPTDRPMYDVTVSCDDKRVERWLERSLDDVRALQLAADDDRYLGAGPPWYLTLFGRDSLISAGMLIPVDPGLAAGTLRALAARQGTKVDAGSAEQPGKVPHELRAEVADHGGGLVLPAVYYGTNDATQLWITTLHKAWRWGMPSDEVGDLLPNLKRALTWMREYADPDGDGILEYIDESGHGLANQGWKDSVDAVQWPDGTLATAPIALCEVQGYAYAAAIKGAELLEAYGESGDEWREWAAALQERFRAAFWVDGYPAIALDGAKNPVPGRASNMGHLLGTGLLDADEEQTVADVLAGADLNSGFGLRTLSTAMTRFNPLGYHTGSVWPHDTAMTVQGLYAAGQFEVASAYAEGLVRAAEAFKYRLPELYGGRGASAERTPTPYPLSCRPQAWAAASAVAVLVASLGIEPDVPGGTLTVTPGESTPWRTLELTGLHVGPDLLSVRSANGKTTVTKAH
ncbi:glycogen debranching N-terminal domain-containing protein [Kribbella solani]|uniref:amylo-alpha-1,6-glucosidase n=1 Tax=Kribbella solani TaxID=236067 RepID=UPI0029B74D2A|nr:glycogen debranching N-terminal domain-containing protein [Kribbella solani]MDX3005210.1 glycogen debranching N-terminal domain-containing protein [Kribbella solani]